MIKRSAAGASEIFQQSRESDAFLTEVVRMICNNEVSSRKSPSSLEALMVTALLSHCNLAMQDKNKIKNASFHMYLNRILVYEYILFLLRIILYLYIYRHFSKMVIHLQRSYTPSCWMLPVEGNKDFFIDCICMSAQRQIVPMIVYKQPRGWPFMENNLLLNF